MPHIRLPIVRFAHFGAEPRGIRRICRFAIGIFEITNWVIASKGVQRKPLVFLYRKSLRISLYKTQFVINSTNKPFQAPRKIFRKYIRTKGINSSCQYSLRM